jgi:hypothetical protein
MSATPSRSRAPRATRDIDASCRDPRAESVAPIGLGSGPAGYVSISLRAWCCFHQLDELDHTDRLRIGELRGSLGRQLENLVSSHGKRMKLIITGWARGLAVLLACAPYAAAQSPSSGGTPSPPAKVDLETIGKVCSGISSATVPGGEGSYTEAGGYQFKFNADRSLEVTRSGSLFYKIDKLSYSDYYNCVAKLAETLSRPPINQPKLCRIPANGVESFRREFDVSRQSSEMSGGHSQPEWCINLIAILRGEYPGGEFNAIASSERSRSGCAPFNCPLYTYSCTVHVKADPIYKEAVSPDCP